MPPRKGETARKRARAPKSSVAEPSSFSPTAYITIDPDPDFPREYVGVEEEMLRSENDGLRKLVRIYEAKEGIPKAASKAFLLKQGSSLMMSIEEALEYKPESRRNDIPPLLRLDADAAYLDELRKLRDELKRFNDLMASRATAKTKSKSGIEFGKIANTFLNHFATQAGKSLGNHGGTAIVIMALVCYMT